MHIRTFKAKAANLFKTANPGWIITDTLFGPTRNYGPQFQGSYRSKDEREYISWRVRVQSGNHVQAVLLKWGYSDGFWIKQ